ncbi:MULTISPECIES: hypothetical protein [Priestia]|uniref:Uncharacterized protein n=1 Tax=Priestia veravalensis TaxID=1414648 RepID=A0A0V8JGG7_9BACI|nr:MULTISPECIES: hypothetical protein [Priestia]KSU86148.1 hypothetical protein AS180_20190 [Priestia veravalensis]SCC57085.1 hypothetical protein GA0061087_10992 [Priestia flexa]
MSEKNPPSINNLLSGVLDFTNTQTRVSEQLAALKQPMVIGYPKPYKVTNFSGTEILAGFQKLGELIKTADFKAQPFLDAGIIQHRESLSLAIKNATSISGRFVIDMPFITQLKIADSILTLQEGFKIIPNYGEILKKAVSMPHATLYRDIFDSLNNEKLIEDSSIEEVEEALKNGQVIDELEDIDEQEINVVRPEFIQASEKLTSYVHTTNYYVTHHHHYAAPEAKEEKSFWNKALPYLILIGDLIHQLGMSSDPINELGYVRAVTKIIHTIEEHPVEQHDMQYEFKQNKDELNKFDSVDSEKTSS